MTIVIWITISHSILSFKRKKVLKLFEKYPKSFVLQMLHRDEFTYYDKFIRGRCHNTEYIKKTDSKIIEKDFSQKHLDAILALPENIYKVWQDNIIYILRICETYNDALFSYVVNNKIWQSWNIEPKEVDQHYLESLPYDLLHKLAIVHEEQYAQLQLECEGIYNILDKKLDAELILDFFKSYNIRYLYHFTDRKNIPSIIKNGGLYSWVACEEEQISIANPGGDSLSRSLDCRKKISDYVHLSFAQFHPMSYKLEKSGAKITILKIHPVVALMSDTLFSNTNATSNEATIGDDINALRSVEYEATQRAFVKRTDPKFGHLQAEVLVKRHIPLKYILNIKDFD